MSRVLVVNRHDSSLPRSVDRGIQEVPTSSPTSLLLLHFL